MVFQNTLSRDYISNCVLSFRASDEEVSSSPSSASPKDIFILVILRQSQVQLQILTWKFECRLLAGQLENHIFGFPKFVQDLVFTLKCLIFKDFESKDITWKPRFWLNSHNLCGINFVHFFRLLLEIVEFREFLYKCHKCFCFFPLFPKFHGFHA